MPVIGLDVITARYGPHFAIILSACIITLFKDRVILHKHARPSNLHMGMTRQDHEEILIQMIPKITHVIDDHISVAFHDFSNKLRLQETLDFIHKRLDKTDTRDEELEKLYTKSIQSLSDLKSEINSRFQYSTDRNEKMQVPFKTEIKLMEESMKRRNIDVDSRIIRFGDQLRYLSEKIESEKSDKETFKTETKKHVEHLKSEMSIRESKAEKSGTAIRKSQTDFKDEVGQKLMELREDQNTWYTKVKTLLHDHGFRVEGDNTVIDSNTTAVLSFAFNVLLDMVFLFFNIRTNRRLTAYKEALDHVVVRPAQQQGDRRDNPVSHGIQDDGPKSHNKEEPKEFNITDSDGADGDPGRDVGPLKHEGTAEEEDTAGEPQNGDSEYAGGHSKLPSQLVNIVEDKTGEENKSQIDDDEDAGGHSKLPSQKVNSIEDKAGEENKSQIDDSEDAGGHSKLPSQKVNSIEDKAGEENKSQIDECEDAGGHSKLPSQKVNSINNSSEQSKEDGG